MKTNVRVLAVLAAAVVSGGTAAAGAEYKAGVARVAITPKVPIRMSGYAVRTKPSQGVVHDIWAKALAVEDSKRGRVVFVTVDSLTIPGAVANEAAQRARVMLGLRREQIVFNASHTHAGPMVGTALYAQPEDPAEAAVVRDYTAQFTKALVDVMSAAVGSMSPADVEFGIGDAPFAGNRRLKTEKGWTNAQNPAGPVDHDVPVLVAKSDGKVRAVLFGYACHNTTAQGENYMIAGDYAGFAQLAVEKAYPGATALFMELCAGDQNPYPRGTMALAEQHGQELADAVRTVLDSKTKPVQGAVRTAFTTTELRFQPHTRETYESRLKETDAWRVKNAKWMLAQYDAGRPVRSIAYPVQAVRLGSGALMLFLGGEVVVDYSLRAKREFAGEPLVVAGYSNDVMCYIPSLRVLREGGYEADSSMIYYGMPGPFQEDVEEKIFAAARDVVKRVKR